MDTNNNNDQARAQLMEAINGALTLLDNPNRPLFGSKKECAHAQRVLQEAKEYLEQNPSVHDLSVTAFFENIADWDIIDWVLAGENLDMCSTFLRVPPDIMEKNHLPAEVLYPFVLTLLQYAYAAQEDTTRH
jgi:hypothetical protein